MHLAKKIDGFYVCSLVECVVHVDRDVFHYISIDRDKEICSICVFFNIASIFIPTP